MAFRPNSDVERSVDVAIVGGGAAAAAAAITLSHSRCRAVAIASYAPPNCGRVGESLAPCATQLLEELGLSALFAQTPRRESHAHYSSWGSSLLARDSALASASGAGYVVDRLAFDGMLHASLERSGVPIVRDTVAEVRQCDSVWELRLAGGNTIRAAFAIDCSGRRAVVARCASRRRRADRLVAAYAFLQQAAGDVETTPARLIEAVEDGWWYATLLPDQRLSLAYFTDSDCLPAALTRDLSAWRRSIAQTRWIGQWIDSAVYTVDVPPHLASAGFTWIEPFCGKTWAAAGDAAIAFDPLSSHGLSTALWSGRSAAEAALTAIAGHYELLAEFGRTVSGALRSALAQRRAVYGSERRFPERSFWARRAKVCKF